MATLASIEEDGGHGPDTGGDNRMNGLALDLEATASSEGQDTRSDESLPPLVARMLPDGRVIIGNDIYIALPTTENPGEAGLARSVEPPNRQDESHGPRLAPPSTREHPTVTSNQSLRGSLPPGFIQSDGSRGPPFGHGAYGNSFHGTPGFGGYPLPPYHFPAFYGRDGFAAPSPFPARGGQGQPHHPFQPPQSLNILADQYTDPSISDFPQFSQFPTIEELNTGILVYQAYSESVAMSACRGRVYTRLPFTSAFPARMLKFIAVRLHKPLHALQDHDVVQFIRARSAPPQVKSLESILHPLRWPAEDSKGPQNLPTDLMTFEMDFQELMDLHAVLARYPEKDIIRILHDKIARTVPKFHSYCTLHFFSLADHTSALKHLNLYWAALEMAAGKWATAAHSMLDLPLASQPVRILSSEFLLPPFPLRRVLVDCCTGVLSALRGDGQQTPSAWIPTPAWSRSSQTLPWS